MVCSGRGLLWNLLRGLSELYRELRRARQELASSAFDHTIKRGARKQVVSCASREKTIVSSARPLARPFPLDLTRAWTPSWYLNLALLELELEFERPALEFVGSLDRVERGALA